MTQQPDLVSIIHRLADEEWKRLRRHWNKQFMTYGPGDSWERIKLDPVYLQDQEVIRLLRDYLTLPAE